MKGPTPRKDWLVRAVLALGLIALATLSTCRNSLLQSIQEDVEKATYVGSPELVVTQGMTLILAGESYHLFQDIATNAIDSERKFTILNNGDANLILTSVISVSLTGDPEFNITTPQKIYAPGESDKFSLTFNPKDQKNYSVKLTIQSNDTSQSDFYFTVTGNGSTSDSTAPQISSKLPANSAELVPIDSNISVTFSEEMNINVASDAIFRLCPTDSPLSLVAGTYARDADGDVVTLDPSDSLQPDTQYSAQIHQDAADLAGNKLLGAPYTWSFTTLPLPGAPALTAPANAAVDQALLPTLDWSDATNAESYELFYGTSPGFEPTPNATVTGSPLPSQYTLGGLARATTYYWKIVAVNSSGKTASAIVYSFTTIPIPPALPTLSSPSNGSAGLGLSVTLTWAAASGATSYKVYCDTTSDPTTLKTTTTSTSYVMATSYSTPYCWKVEAVNAGGSATSVVWRFDTLYPPGAPVLSSPANGATGQGTSVTFSWAAGSGGAASSYKVYCDTTNPPTTLKTTTTSTSYAMTAVYSTRYFWKVEALNVAGSATSVIRQFDSLYPPGAPTLSAPANAATGLTSPVTLSWAAGSGGTPSSYKVYCDTTNPPTTLKTTTTSTSYAMTASYSTRYYWKVEAVNSAGTGPASGVRYFDTLYAPGTPVLVSPVKGATVGNPATLSWTAGSGGAPAAYYVYCDTSTNPTTLVTKTSSTSYPMSTKPKTAYFWKVQAYNAVGSATSIIWNFDTNPPASAPTLLTPASAASAQSLFVKFTWSAVSGATGYDLYLGTTSPPALFKSVTTTSYTPTAPLLCLTSYYWKVVPKNAAGTGPASAIPKFATRKDDIYPFDKSTGVTRTPIECDWTAVTNATKYVLEASVNGTTYYVLAQTSTHYFFDTDPKNALAAGTKFYWRVTAYSSIGTKLYTFGPYTFVTGP